MQVAFSAVDLLAWPRKAAAPVIGQEMEQGRRIEGRGKSLRVRDATQGFRVDIRPVPLDGNP